jgi:hypothetical protein
MNKNDFTTFTVLLTHNPTTPNSMSNCNVYELPYSVQLNIFSNSQMRSLKPTTILTRIKCRHLGASGFGYLGKMYSSMRTEGDY